jgi:hyperosmotically inducible periplasmic protein
MKVASQITVRTALLASLVLGGWALAGAQSNEQSTPQPDNTKMNQGDHDPNAVTADQQGMNKSDRDITQQVRKAIIADKSLSTYAHNVKIVTQNGSITLKGPVRSEDEKQAIAAKAAEVVGGDKVTNQLEIKPKQ